MSFNFSVYRKFVTTNEGKRILLRPLTEEDHKALVELFSASPEGDFHFLKDDVRNPVVLERWTSNIDYSRVLPMVAVYENRLVGDCSLHLGRRSARHMGEVRIFLAPDFRGVGLGSKMIQEMEEVARKIGLMFLNAEIILDHVGVVKAFRRLGYELRCSAVDFFLTAEGTTHDLALLTKRLTRQEFTF